MKIIDAHTHFGYLERKDSLDRETIDELLSKHNYEKILLFPISLKEKTLNNKGVLKISDELPSKIIPGYWENLGSDDYLGNVKNAIKHGFKIVKIHPDLDNISCDDKRIINILNFLQEKNIPLFIHTSNSSLTEPRKIISLSERFPQQKIVALHSWTGEMNVNNKIVSNRILKCENLFFEFSHCMWFNVINIFKNVGHERIIFGSDFPIGNPSVEIQKINQLTSVPKMLGAMFYDNILKILKT